MFRERFAARLAAGPPLVLDGAMGTLLAARGLPPGLPPWAWNRERPEEVERVHREYLRAGADVILTNSFGAAARVSRGTGALKEANSAAATLARRAAAGSSALVAGCLAPLGARGTLPADRLEAAYRDQLEALAEADLDLVVAETMLDAGECRAAVTVTRAVLPDIPILVMATFDEAGTGLGGMTPEEVACVLAETGADAVGVNCSWGPAAVTAIAARMAAATAVPIAAKPNAGLPQRSGEGWAWPAAADDWGALALRLAAAGVRAIGGCCGTTPAHVAAMAAALRPAQAIK